MGFPRPVWDACLLTSRASECENVAEQSEVTLDIREGKVHIRNIEYRKGAAIAVTTRCDTKTGIPPHMGQTGTADRLSTIHLAVVTEVTLCILLRHSCTRLISSRLGRACRVYASETGRTSYKKDDAAEMVIPTRRGPHHAAGTATAHSSPRASRIRSSISANSSVVGYVSRICCHRAIASIFRPRASRQSP